MNLKLERLGDGTLLVWNEDDSSILRWNEVSLDEAIVKEYLEEHPFPDDPAYGVQALMFDLNSGTGVSFWKDTKEETVDYIIKMIGELV